jgi:Nucleotidyl transferase AbiEii toxin, Type IV TA system
VTGPGPRETGSPAQVRARTRAHRAALDHVLEVIAQAPWSEGLVLRGSMAMTAWEPAAAREPQDLDWIVPRVETAVDGSDPFPYINDLATVQQWPEAADGAAAEEIWSEQDPDTGGRRPRLPPEGLRWIQDPAPRDPPFADLLDRVAARPQAARGVLLDAAGADTDSAWGYAYDTAGARLLIPWHAEGLEPGTVQLDFAADEPLPDAPVFAAVPRGDGGPPTVVRAAGREASLAWKLLWLHADSARGGCRTKDLYDALLLAESDRTRLTARLVRRVVRQADSAREALIEAGPLTVRTVRRWRLADEDDGFEAGDSRLGRDPGEWIERFAIAVGPVLTALNNGET